LVGVGRWISLAAFALQGDDPLGEIRDKIVQIIKFLDGPTLEDKVLVGHFGMLGLATPHMLDEVPTQLLGHCVKLTGQIGIDLVAHVGSVGISTAQGKATDARASINYTVV